MSSDIGSVVPARGTGPAVRPSVGPSEGADRFTVPGWVERSLGRFDQRVVTWVLAAGGAVAAFLLRWTQDDSFISLRYARNLVEGRGLVYNPGEQVEGYTNFLWTVLMAVPHGLGWDPVAFGHAVGIASLAATVVVTARLGARVFASPVLGNLTAAVLLTNLTVVLYGTGGLETQLQTASVTSVWLIAVPVLVARGTIDLRAGSAPPGAPPALSTAALAVLSGLAGVALLVRLDSALIVAVPAGAVVLAELRRSRRRVEPLRWAALCGPVLVLVVPWTLWRVVTYGGLLPNTVAAKANSLGVTLQQGGAFLVLFAVFNLLVVFVPVAWLRGRELLGRRPFAAVALTLGLWLVFLLKVGADFMEFRFMVPVVPLLSLVLVGLILSTRTPRRQQALVAVLVLGFLVHALTFQGMLNVDSAAALGRKTGGGADSWATIGARIGQDLGGSAAAEEPGSGAPVISVGAAGVIPYTARLRNVDAIGLTDPRTARHGLPTRTGIIPKQGHARVATIDHLVRERVNLLLGEVAEPHAHAYDAEEVRALYWGNRLERTDLPPGATAVEMPLGDGRVYWMLYLLPHPRIEALIRSGAWDEVPLDL